MAAGASDSKVSTFTLPTRSNQSSITGDASSPSSPQSSGKKNSNMKDHDEERCLRTCYTPRITRPRPKGPLCAEAVRDLLRRGITHYTGEGRVIPMTQEEMDAPIYEMACHCACHGGNGAYFAYEDSECTERWIDVDTGEVHEVKNAVHTTYPPGYHDEIWIDIDTGEVHEVKNAMNTTYPPGYHDEL